MSTQAKLIRLQDLDDRDKTRTFADRDLGAMCTIADWIGNFVIRPHPDLGRSGPVCPFVPRALEVGTLCLAAEQVTGRGPADFVNLVRDYRDQMLGSRPREGEMAGYKAIVVVLSDLSAERAGDVFGNAHFQDLKRSSYAEHGVVIGEFHERNEGSAIRNPGFKPFKSPVPFLLLRQAVISDWMFFLDNDDWLNRWAGRFGDAALRALATRLRNTNWRSVES